MAYEGEPDWPAHVAANMDQVGTQISIKIAFFVAIMATAGAPLPLGVIATLHRGSSALRATRWMEPVRFRC
jgi:hypothetical protein